MEHDIVWVSGASSGIGAAFVDQAPSSARVIGISRRPQSRGEHFEADLADPASWRAVAKHFAEILAAEAPASAVFFHCAGTLTPIGPISKVDERAYTAGVLLNSASGQVLGRAFLAAAASAGCQATLVMCSSPGASDALAGMSQYCAGKAALEHWVRSVAQEPLGEARIFAVVPHAVDTPMVRAAMDTPAEDVPIGEFFRQAAASQALAAPSVVAAEIWKGIERGVAQGGVLELGARDLAATSS